MECSSQKHGIKRFYTLILDSVRLRPGSDKSILNLIRYPRTMFLKMRKQLAFGFMGLLLIPVLGQVWATTDLTTLHSPNISITPTSGPPGTKITVTITNLPDISKETYPYPELYIYFPFSKPFGVTVPSHCGGDDCLPVYTYDDALRHDFADRTITFSLFSTSNPKPIYLNGFENSVCDIVMSGKTIERFSTLCNTKDEPTGTYQIMLAWALQSDLEKSYTTNTVQFTVTPGSLPTAPQVADNGNAILKQYQNNQISQAEFESKLKALGWNDEQIRQAEAVVGKLPHQLGAPAPDQFQQVHAGAAKAEQVNTSSQSISTPSGAQLSEQSTNTSSSDQQTISSPQQNSSWTVIAVIVSIAVVAAIGGGIVAVKQARTVSK